MTQPPLQHVIVDGSNIATEGRDTPSLAQLDEAVQAFIREYEPEIVTVVVDATFPNRIARSERQVYEDAIVAGELITPPAGAVGRGDAFVLQIADRADATVLSNDSFQEFHGEYRWLFDQGRLIGGKPVPHVGWVFMDRSPVRGPASRRAVSAARRAGAADRAPDTGKPSPEVKAKPKASRQARPKPVEKGPAPAAPEPAEARPAPPPLVEAPETATPAEYNELLPFVEFVGEHPLGSEVDAVVERFGSHGAYLRCGTVRAYAPLKNLSRPAPRSAKEVLRAGETRRFVVAAIDPRRRGIDLALPEAGAPEPVPEPAPAPESSAKQATKKQASEKRSTARKQAAKKTATRKGAPKQASPKQASRKQAASKQGAAKKAAAKKAAPKKRAARRRG
jgi:hypothetical protein